MARIIGTIRNNAAYLFLIKGGNGQAEYELFILVPYAANQEVSYTDKLSYLHGITTITIDIIDKPGAIQGRFFKRISLQPEQEARRAGYTFDPNEFCVKVNTKYRTRVNEENVVTTITTRVFYGDVNYDDANDNIVIIGEQAADSVYMHLPNPNTDTEEQKYSYDPCCIITLSEYDISNPLDQKYSDVIDNVKGQCLQEITLFRQSPNGKEEIPVDLISANNNTYDDRNKQEGYFEVELTLARPPGQGPGKSTKRKGRLRNASADTHPSSFIEINPFFP